MTEEQIKISLAALAIIGLLVGLSFFGLWLYLNVVGCEIAAIFGFASGIAAAAIVWLGASTLSR